MDCIAKSKQGAEILLDYAAGTLDASRSAELTSHIRQCSECRELVEAQNTVWEMLGAWKPAEVSPDFDAKLYARIAAEDRVPAWKQWLNRIWKPAVPLAAAAAVLSLALLLRVPDWGERIPETPAPQAQVAPSTPAPAAGQAQTRSGAIDADQVEQGLEDLDLLAPSAM